jgi:hypothetical protein
MKVALEGEQIQSKLWDLWAQCPSVICLSTPELSTSVAPDVAAKIYEVLSVYLASFWILFVYLHRVCWWHLPLTEAVTGAVDRTWQHMKDSCGEADKKDLEKTVLPALMWPLFLFGAECKTDECRNWAVDQLKALGGARPGLISQNQCLEILPSFYIGHYATRNGKRAALLLEVLIRKQEEMNCRVDDGDLAMDTFGCSFSLI